MESNFDINAFSPAMQRILSNAEKAYRTINHSFIDNIPSFDVIMQYVLRLQNALQTTVSWDIFFQKIENCSGITSDIFITNNCEEKILHHSIALYSDVTEAVTEAYKKQTRTAILEQLYQKCAKLHGSVLLTFIADEELLSDVLRPFNCVPNIYKGSMCYVSSANLIISTLVCCMLCEKIVENWEDNSEKHPVQAYIDEHFEKYGWFNIITMAKNTFSDCCFQCGNEATSAMLNNSDIFGLIIYFYKFPF